MKKFNHLTCWNNCDKLVGEIITTENWTETNYYKNKENKEVSGQIVKDGDPVISLIKSAFSQSLDPVNASVVTDIIMSTIKGYKYTSELMKEMIFEEVRNNHFTERPSRKRCIFALTEDINIKEFRVKSGLTEIKRKNIIKIEPVDNKSKVFIADAELLNCNTLSIDEIRDKAKLYWDGSGALSFPEVLIEGEFKVIGIVDNGN